jgi:ATP phosphoribosyltransferase regulatory subunit
VFEVVASALGPTSPVAGGGRYDGLLAEVGAPVPVPAVGASIHTERLLAALQERAP